MNGTSAPGGAEKLDRELVDAALLVRIETRELEGHWLTACARIIARGRMLEICAGMIAAELAVAGGR